MSNSVIKKITMQSEERFWGLTLMDIVKLATIFASMIWIYATFGSRLDNLEKNQEDRKVELDKYKVEVATARREDKAEYKELLQDIKKSIDNLSDDIREMYKKK